MADAYRIRPREDSPPETGEHLVDSAAWDRVETAVGGMLAHHRAIHESAIVMRYHAQDADSGRIVEASPAFREALGYDPSGLVVTDIIHPDDIGATVAAWQRLLDGNPVTDGFPNRYRTADGSHVWILWTGPVAQGETPEIGTATGIRLATDGLFAVALADIAHDRGTA